MMDKWDRRFLELARLVSTWSKDPSTHCGAVIVRKDRTICSTGYNGFPRGMLDSSELYLDRDVKLKRIIHAETNAILTAKEDLRGCTLYTCPFLSCPRCAVMVIQAGISRCVAPVAREGREERWDLTTTRAFFLEAGVEWQEYDYAP